MQEEAERRITELDIGLAERKDSADRAQQLIGNKIIIAM